jgi:D-alanine-D-alanine ligase
MVTGAGVLAALSELGFHTKDIIVSKSGEWLVQGMIKKPEKALMTADVVFIAMHGAYGEDGTVQRICERLHIPFTGSNSFPSARAFNKDAAKRALASHGIKTPKHVRLRRDETRVISEVVDTIAELCGPEYVLKPTTSGSSHGVVMVPNAGELKRALETMLRDYDECMVEERIRGTEATCGVLADFRGEKLYVLPSIEIIPPTTSDFFTADAKYSGATIELCPGRFSFSEKATISDMATTVHDVLGLSQYSRSDFIVKNGEVYFLEVNTLPGLTPESLFPKAAAAVGLSFPQLIDHLVKTARVH